MIVHNNNNLARWHYHLPNVVAYKLKSAIYISLKKHLHNLFQPTSESAYVGVWTPTKFKSSAKLK